MVLIDKLTAIGDAIREKTGGKEKLTLDEMAEAIRKMKVERPTSDQKTDREPVIGRNIANE